MVCEQVEGVAYGEGGTAAGFGDVGGSTKPVQVDDGVADRGRDLWTGAGADGRAVLVERHVAHPVDAVLDSPVLAQPGGDRGGASLFERQAADCVDHLDGAGTGGDHDAFAGDLNDLSGVGESDAAGGGEDLQGASFAAAVAAVVVGADNRDLGPRECGDPASSLAWFDLTTIR